MGNLIKSEVSFGYIVKKLIEIRGIKVAELARKLEMPHTTINRIITGNTDNPSANTLIALADFFKVSIDYLLGRESKFERHDNHQAKSFAEYTPEYIPLIEWHSIRGWFFHKKEILSEKQCPQIGISKKLSPNAFAVIAYKSFGKNLPEGSILIIDSEDRYNAKDFLLVSINKNSPTIRELHEEGGKFYLESLGPSIPAVELDPSNVSVFGKVMECRALFN